MFLHVQLIPKKMTWSGAVKLISSQLSFLCCLSLNTILFKSWCLCVLPTPARFTQTDQRMVEQTVALMAYEMHSQGLVTIMWLHPVAWRQVNYKSFLLLTWSSESLQVRKWEMLINLNLLIYLGLKMSCGVQPKGLFVSCFVICVKPYWSHFFVSADRFLCLCVAWASSSP